MSRVLLSTLFVYVVVSNQLFSLSKSKLQDLKASPEIFAKYHTAVVKVITHTNTGNGFSIKAEESDSITEKGEKSRFVVTAAHVVKSANSTVDLYIYHDEKDTNGNWKKDFCSASIYGLDIVRDVALLEISCYKCNCLRLGALQTGHSPVNGEKIFVIGNSGNRRPDSPIRGSLSSTNISFSPATLFYELDNNIAATKFVSRVHELTGSLNFGDAGSAVMTNTGDVIGMILNRSRDHNFCVTMEEIFKAYEQILNTMKPSFVACTAHEAAFLDRKYWGDSAGKSIKEINALATAMNAQYFAVAHDSPNAHAFTFDFLWWEILPENYSKEHSSQCRCETNSFTDSEFVSEGRQDGMDMCGCAENACRRLSYYERRFGEDKDRRWAVYKQNKAKPRQYVPSQQSLALMKNIAGEIDYWKKKVGNSKKENEQLVSMMINTKQRADRLTTELKEITTELKEITTELKEKDLLISRIYMTISVAVVVVSSLFIYFYIYFYKEVCAQNERLLEERLNQQAELQNPIARPAQEMDERNEDEVDLR